MSAGLPEVVVVKAAKGPTCQIHDWPTDGLARRLVDRMRASFDKGGVDVCRDCIARARDSLKVPR